MSKQWQQQNNYYMSICTVHLLLLQDGNGPDPQWGFHLLGDEDGVILLPNGAFMGRKTAPSCIAGLGTVPVSPSPSPIGAPIVHRCICQKTICLWAQLKVYQPKPTTAIYKKRSSPLTLSSLHLFSYQSPAAIRHHGKQVHARSSSTMKSFHRHATKHILAATC
jgi:hypothetical protein